MTSERRQAAIAGSYLRAKRAVLGSKYASEVIEAPAVGEITEGSFLRELAWVVLSAGMSEAVVRSKFPSVSECFLRWESADLIVRSRDECVAAAMEVFGHIGKLSAIAEAAAIVSAVGFQGIKHAVARDPFVALRRFPYIGPATVHHLAKNLGVSTAKPDRHLGRLSAAAGHASPGELCRAIAAFVGDDVRTVDAVLWRFATLNRDYIRRFLAPDGPAC